MLGLSCAPRKAHNTSWQPSRTSKLRGMMLSAPAPWWAANGQGPNRDTESGAEP